MGVMATRDIPSPDLDDQPAHHAAEGRRERETANDGDDVDGHSRPVRVLPAIWAIPPKISDSMMSSIEALLARVVKVHVGLAVR